MQKKFIVAVATSLILANGTSVALATGGSDDTTTTSTTVPRSRVNPNVTDPQRAAQRAAQQAQQAAQRAAQQAQQAAQRAAQQAQQAAQRAAQQAQQAAQRAAQQAQQAAQRAAQEAQHGTIAKYKAELAKYLETLKLINTTFQTSKVDAQRAFKIARESATTKAARRLAETEFRTAVSIATQTKNAAIRTLGAPPAKPVKP